MEEDLLKDIALCVEFSDEVVKQIRNGSITEISVEINEEIVPKRLYDETFFKDGDVVEVVNFVGGG